jgi:hypothetical protein
MAKQTEFIQYEQALELKELGFNEACMDYKIDEKKCSYQDVNGDCVYPNCICELNYQPLGIPLYQQAFRWFREKHGLVGLINIGTQKFSYYVFNEKTDSREVTSPINGTYEEAELASLKKLIEIVKNKL